MDVKEIFMEEKYMVPLCMFQQIFFSEFVFQFPRDLTLSHKGGGGDGVYSQPVGVDRNQNFLAGTKNLPGARFLFLVTGYKFEQELQALISYLNSWS